jgi:3-oxoacyl-[acyl-carrier-protein] synthase-1
MRKVVVTGLGFASSIGSSRQAVVDSLLSLRHGFEAFPAKDGELRTPKFLGTVKDYSTGGWDSEDWEFPVRFKIPRAVLKSMSPHVLYAYCTALDALEDAGLDLEAISDPRTGLYSASAGSTGLMYQQLGVMNNRGVARCSPYSVVAATVGAINFNLGAALKIQGSICGFASACASSAHALGYAYDAITLGRQDRMIVIGAEDCTRETILPFATMRALSNAPKAERASCPFDSGRSGFVGSGGATALILESEESARARKASAYSELVGWSEAGDGHSPAMPHPEGRGLKAAMQGALKSTGLEPSRIDYVNAHATSTAAGDLAEMKAIKAIFGQGEDGPWVSSTKALTGHPLSLAGALEAGFCGLALNQGFVPGSAHIEKLDPEGEGLKILRETKREQVEYILSNSSGFGGSNVSLIFRRWSS